MTRICLRFKDHLTFGAFGFASQWHLCQGLGGNFRPCAPGGGFHHKFKPWSSEEGDDKEQPSSDQSYFVFETNTTTTNLDSTCNLHVDLRFNTSLLALSNHLREVAEYNDDMAELIVSEQIDNLAVAEEPTEPTRRLVENQGTMVEGSELIEARTLAAAFSTPQPAASLPATNSPICTTEAPTPHSSEATAVHASETTAVHEATAAHDTTAVHASKIPLFTASEIPLCTASEVPLCTASESPLCTASEISLWPLRQVPQVGRHLLANQPQITPEMRRILVDWLVELSDELQLGPETLLLGVYKVDSFLSVERLPKGSLQLVGAIALMHASNSFCKLPRQDGQVPPTQGELTTAVDVEYWTDGTYSACEVIEMESRMVLLHETRNVESEFCSSIGALCEIFCTVDIAPESVAIAVELLLLCARETASYALHPRFLAAVCLFLAVINGPSAANPMVPGRRNVWTSAMSRACGFSVSELESGIREHLHFLPSSGEELNCRPLDRSNHEGTITFSLSRRKVGGGD